MSPRAHNKQQKFSPSAIGTKQTSALMGPMSAWAFQADIQRRVRHVREVPQAEVASNKGPSPRSAGTPRIGGARVLLLSFPLRKEGAFKYDPVFLL
jgi:hypothetical protein